MNQYPQAGGPIATCTPIDETGILDRLRSLASTAIANLERAERIKWSILHGPTPEPVGKCADNPCMMGLEDIYDILNAAVYNTEDRLCFIESKLGK
jgi:hypothetical protein